MFDENAERVNLIRRTANQARSFGGKTGLFLFSFRSSTEARNKANMGAVRRPPVGRFFAD
ncbi:hypothetical protein RRSWK_02196 [Rhodopirellula sp. SWK7]|nr:hypothetical protein RRSWK_02196 [Rhodopirellula sp. SWK7]